MELEVLLVDDEEEFVDAFAERLRLRGFVTHIANNGQDALRIVSAEAIWLMVLDIKMPGMDGFEVLRRVKSSRPDVQVIILSGHGSERDEEIARGLGAFEYLKKPANIDVIVEALRRAAISRKTQAVFGGPSA